jgi:hypothetical protein
MKTILYILGGLLIFSRLHGQGLTVAGTLTAAPGAFGTTPAGGGAGIITPPAGDPYANLYTGEGGAGAVPNMVGVATNSYNIGSHFGLRSGSYSGSGAMTSPSPLLSRVRGTREFTS